MTICGKEKRRQGRVKREYMVEIKVGNEVKKIYSIDLSEGGVKVGGAMLMLKPGEEVDTRWIGVEKNLRSADRSQEMTAVNGSIASAVMRMYPLSGSSTSFLLSSSSRF